MGVRQSVCLSASISPEPPARYNLIFVHVAYGCGSVLRCDTLCTYGFVDDNMFFSYNGPYGGMTFATKDRFRLNLLLYRKVGQKSISCY